MTELAYHTTAEVLAIEDRDADDGAAAIVEARLVPYGDVAATRHGPERFEGRGSLAVPAGGVPFSVIHERPGAGTVLERIGWLTATDDRADGLYGTLRISDTANGRDVATLMRDGVARKLSIGFVPGDTSEERGVLVRRASANPAQLDHVTVVPTGAYARAEALSVREDHSMDDVTTHEAPATAEAEQAPTEDRAPAPPPPPAAPPERAAPLHPHAEDRLRSLEALVTAAGLGTLQETRRRPPLGQAVKWTIEAQRGNQRAAMELRVLAVDSTTTAAGLVPDAYSSEIISIVDEARPFIADLDPDPLDEFGMETIYPEVTQKPQVGKQSAEGAEVASRQMTVAPKAVPIDTFAGANTVNVQLIDRSTPAYLSAFYREMAGQYAQETELEAETVVLGTAGIGTSVLAVAADAATTVGALVDAAVGIAKATRRMPDTLWGSPDRWGQLVKLVDSGGRPLFPWVGNNPQNALGQSSLASMAGQVSGLRLRMVPNFAGTGTLILGWSGAAAALEQDPIQLRALQVSTLQWELGVYGYFAIAVKYPAGFHSFTTV